MHTDLAVNPSLHRMTLVVHPFLCTAPGVHLS
jgi:hypothetical protein